LKMDWLIYTQSDLGEIVGWSSIMFVTKSH
jgi:hypothetical protein